jgi:hypothetical protein
MAKVRSRGSEDASSLLGIVSNQDQGQAKDHQTMNTFTKSALSAARYKRNNSEKLQAQAVAKALTEGLLERPEICSSCKQNPGDIIGHHESYLPEHRLDVIWLCMSCHSKLHNAARRAKYKAKKAKKDSDGETNTISQNSQNTKL